jgi:hypothetical protein
MDASCAHDDVSADVAAAGDRGAHLGLVVPAPDLLPVEQCSFLPPVVPHFGASVEQFVEPDFFGSGEVDEIWRDLTRTDPMLFEVQARA